MRARGTSVVCNRTHLVQGCCSLLWREPTATIAALTAGLAFLLFATLIIHGCVVIGVSGVVVIASIVVVAAAVVVSSVVVVSSAVVVSASAVVVSAVVTIVVNSGCVNAIIEAAVLGDCDIYGLMISGCIHRAEAVNTSRKTCSQIGGKSTILLIVVQAFEEGKHRRIGDIGAVEGGNFLDSNMAVRLHDTVVNLLGSTEVVLLGVDKITEVHVLHCHLERKRLIGREFTTVDGERYLRRWHRR